MKDNLAERARERMHGLAESLGNLLMEAFHYLALFAIGAITAWAAVMAFLGMLEKGHITVDDILLLFIYLELAAMVGIYFKTNRPILTHIAEQSALFRGGLRWFLLGVNRS